MNKIANQILFFASCLLVSGCAWIQNLTEEEPEEPKPKAKEALEPGVLGERLNETNLDYEWITASAEMDIEHPSINTSVSSNLKMAKDSLIRGTISAAFSFEVMRFSISPDSIKVIDRYNQVYYSLPFDRYIPNLGQGRDESFSVLQDLLIGNFPHSRTNNFESKIDSPYHRLSQNSPNEEKNINIIADIFKMASFNHSWIHRDDFITIDYSNHQAPTEESNSIIPYQIDIDNSFGGRNRIEIEFDEVSLGMEEEISFNVPESYEKNP